MKETEQQRPRRRRRRPQHANKEVLRRFRNSVIAFFVMALLIVIVIQVAFGDGIRQAKESDVSGVQGILTGGRILAEFFREGDQGEIPPAGKAFADAEAGGAGASVNKYFRHS